MLGSFSAIFSMVLTGIAMLSLLVGGLSTITRWPCRWPNEPAR